MGGIQEAAETETMDGEENELHFECTDLGKLRYTRAHTCVRETVVNIGRIKLERVSMNEQWGTVTNPRENARRMSTGGL